MKEINLSLHQNEYDLIKEQLKLNLSQLCEGLLCKGSILNYVKEAEEALEIFTRDENIIVSEPSEEITRAIEAKNNLFKALDDFKKYYEN